MLLASVFFFQAEDGIRDATVTGVQTCALPISSAAQMALVSAAVAATLLIAHHWRGYQLSRPTEIASVPGAALAIALVLVFAAGEDWPLWPALAATAATLLTVELLAGRLPAASGASLAQSLVLGIGLAAAA